MKSTEVYSVIKGLSAKTLAIIVSIVVPVTVALAIVIVHFVIAGVKNEFKTLHSDISQIKIQVTADSKKTREYIDSSFKTFNVKQKTTNAIFMEEIKDLNNNPQYNKKLDELLCLMNNLYSTAPIEVDEKKT